MLNKLLLIFGLIMTVLGVVGFIPAVAPNGMLLGLFHIDTLHNLIHLVTGLVALLVGYGYLDFLNPVLFFQIFGIVYGLVAILGFVYGNMPIFGILANNMADTYLHSVISLASLYLGFLYKESIV